MGLFGRLPSLGCAGLPADWHARLAGWLAVSQQGGWRAGMQVGKDGWLEGQPGWHGQRAETAAWLAG
jgi:hypothetical protein